MIAIFFSFCVWCPAKSNRTPRWTRYTTASFPGLILPLMRLLSELCWPIRGLGPNSIAQGVLGSSRRKMCNGRQAREIILICTKRGKTCSPLIERQNRQPVPSAGKQATGAKRGKTCHWNQCQVRKSRLHQITVTWLCFTCHMKRETDSNKGF